MTRSPDISELDPAAERVERLRRLYDAFNARDIDAVLVELAENVVWPNGWEGGVLHGKDAVADYWRRQWSAIDPRVEPTAFDTRAPDLIVVTVSQTVRSLDGIVVSQGVVLHTYSFVDHEIGEMTIESAEQ